MTCRPERTDPTSPATVLVADDVKLYREILRHWFSELGYAVVVACDGQQAWRHHQQNSPVLVITDIDMAGGNGFEFIGRIRNADATANHHTPIVVMSSLADDEIESLCQRVGADAFFSKPLNKTHVNELLEQLLPFRPGAKTDAEELPAPPVPDQEKRGDGKSKRPGRDSESTTVERIEHWSTPSETAMRWSHQSSTRISPVLRRIYQATIRDPDTKAG